MEDQASTANPELISKSACPATAKIRALLGECKQTAASSNPLSLFDLIAIKTKDIIKADRVSVFLLDREKCELWSFVSQEKKMMRLDARLGIAGSVAMTGEAINVADAYEHPLFYKEVDSQTGYRTRTLLAVPLKNTKGEIIGVGEAVNKETGLFTNEDAEVLQALAACIADMIESAHLEKQLRQLPSDKETLPQEELSGGFSTQKVIGMGLKIQSVIRLIDQIRDSSVDVLIEGDSGTGKELIAKALHFNSPRAKKPFIALNCAALPDHLVESELFGIEKGVATGVDRRIGKFEEANGGTLFLDEIGDLSLAAQAKILRVIQERLVDRVGGHGSIPVDVRLVAATNKNLRTGINDKTFRDDLYYRLKVIHIQLPRLSEYPPDIPLLANHFLAKYCSSMNIPLKQFTPSALDTLTNYSWPGNARQLENEVKRLVASVRGRMITEDHLESSIRNPSAPTPVLQTGPKGPVDSPRSLTLPAAVEALERRMIEEALRQTAGNKQKAAQALGLSRQGLIKKLKRLGV